MVLRTIPPAALHGSSTHAEIIDWILEARGRYPNWGAKNFWPSFRAAPQNQLAPSLDRLRHPQATPALFPCIGAAVVIGHPGRP